MSGEIVAQLFNDPRTLGEMADADLVGQEGVPGEGPFMTMYLKLEGDIVREAGFQTYNCPYAVACGSWVTRWLVGRTIEQARLLEPGSERAPRRTAVRQGALRVARRTFASEGAPARVGNVIAGPKLSIKAMPHACRCGCKASAPEPSNSALAFRANDTAKGRIREWA